MNVDSFDCRRCDHRFSVAQFVNSPGVVAQQFLQHYGFEFEVVDLLHRALETENWEERKDGSARIDQLVYVARDGHKGIVLGNKGETIKAVGKASREELEEFLGRKVHLFLQVKVRANWLEEAERYSEMGLDFKDGND